MRKCQTTWAFSSLAKSLAFTQGSGRKKQTACSLQCRNLDFSVKSPVLPFFTSFLLAPQNSCVFLSRTPDGCANSSTFVHGLLHFHGCFSSPSCCLTGSRIARHSGRGHTGHMQTRVRRMWPTRLHSSCVHALVYLFVATGLKNPQKCPLLFPFSLWGSRGWTRAPEFMTWRNACSTNWSQTKNKWWNPWQHGLFQHVCYFWIFSHLFQKIGCKMFGQCDAERISIYLHSWVSILDT